MEAYLTNRDRSIHSSVTFFYQHAARKSGRDVDARQNLCMALTGNYCDHRRSGPEICISAKLMCFSVSDPFDPSSGWQRVGVINSDTPTFDSSGLNPITRPILDEDEKVGEISFSCQHRGTYL